jgi:hypothetical protein
MSVSEMTLEQLQTAPVDFPVTDGSSVTVSAFADEVLRTFWGIEKVRAVTANGKTYLYTPHDIPDQDILAFYFGRSKPARRWLFADFCARYILRLHDQLPGDGRIIHDGSTSFFPSNYERELFEEVPEEGQARTGRAARLKQPVVSPEVISWQIGLLSLTELLSKAKRCATQRTTARIAEDVVQDAFLALFSQIRDGRCRATSKGEFFAYVMRTVRNMCSDIATNGLCNGDILPDRLETKLLQDGIRRGEMPDETRSHWHEMDAHEQAACARNFA